MVRLLEVAVSTLDGALAALEGGADRLELSAALEMGGVTPSLGTFLVIRERVNLPIVVLVRARLGGFVYSDRDFLTAQRDAEQFVAHGAAGLAFGFLKTDRTIDVEQTGRLMQQVSGAQTVFHRAFDLTPDPIAALECLIDLGVRRVLTSGQAKSALQGADLLATLIERAAGRIEVLPAAGIMPHNTTELIARTGANQVHGSFSVQCHDLAEPVCDGAYRVTSVDLVRATRKVLDGME